MGMTDPIADMVTRIRNGSRVHFKSVEVFNSRLNLNMAKVLKKSGYIGGYDIKRDPQGHEVLKLYMKYSEAKRPVITDIQRVSKPGRRVYVKRTEIPWVLSGLGVAVLSTPQGIMTDQKARRLGLGGEVLCYVW